MSKQKQWSEMKLKIDGSYVNGTDIGHPDGEGIFHACCCGSIAGSTPEEREHYARLMVAAPEMLKLIQALSTATESGFGSEVSMKTLYGRLVCLRNEVLRLLTRIEGGIEGGGE